MRYFILFLCTKPANSSVYFILTTQLISDLPPFKGSLITCGCWPPSWTALVPTEPWNLYIEQVVQMILMSEQVWKRLDQMLPRGAPNSHFLLEFRGVWGGHIKASITQLAITTYSYFQNISFITYLISSVFSPSHPLCG